MAHKQFVLKSLFYLDLNLLFCFSKLHKFLNCRNFLSMKCPFFDMSCLCFVMSLKCNSKKLPRKRIEDLVLLSAFCIIRNYDNRGIYKAF